MSDIFSTSSELGAGDDPFQSAEAAPVSTDSGDNGSNDAAPPIASTDSFADQGAQDQGTQQPTTSTEGDQSQQPAQLSEADLAKMEQEADAVLSNPQTPKWFKNAVENVYKPKLEKFGKQVEQYSAFGTPEELGEKLGLLDKLYQVQRDPATGMPVKVTTEFVKDLHAKDPDTAYRLMNDLAVMPAPDGSGQTVIQALFGQMGIDPNRLSDIQKFAQNGYQLQAAQFGAPDPGDLALIPEHLHATFAKLAPEIRDSLMGDIDSVRNQNLEAHKFRIETEERNAAQQQADSEAQANQERERQVQFKAQVDTKAEENFNRSSEGVLKSFVESLATQAGMSQLDSLMVANTVLNALEPTLAGQMSLAALKEAGIEIDASVQTTIAELQESAQFAAYHELVGDQQSLQREVARQVELQTKLTAKGSKIIAALAVKRNGSALSPARQVSNQVANTVNQNHAAAAAGTPFNGNRPPVIDQNFGEDDYKDLLTQDPFFARGR